MRDNVEDVEFYLHIVTIVVFNFVLRQSNYLY